MESHLTNLTPLTWDNYTTLIASNSEFSRKRKIYYSLCLFFYLRSAALARNLIIVACSWSLVEEVHLSQRKSFRYMDEKWLSECLTLLKINVNYYNCWF